MTGKDDMYYIQLHLDFYHLPAFWGVQVQATGNSINSAPTKAMV